TPGVLLTVSVADCVPVFLVDERTRAVALLHAGWRGVAAGILTAGIQVLEREAGSEPSDLRVHLGPSICGTCYEVGPEVHEALGLTPPAAPRPVDLRQVLAEQALALGVRAERISRSAYCPRCGDSPFFPHRRGDSGRQSGVLAARGHGAPGAVQGKEARRDRSRCGSLCHLPARARRGEPARVAVLPLSALGARSVVRPIPALAGRTVPGIREGRMEDSFYVARARIEKVEGVHRRARLEAGTTVEFGVKGPIKAHYGIENRKDLPLPVDYLVAAAGA